MLPSDFLAGYGMAVPRIVIADGVTPAVIAADPSRYVLAFWSATGDVFIQPFGAEFLAVAGFNINTGQKPYILTHTLHGAMVNMSWTLRSTGIAESVIVVEGFMRSKTQTRLRRNGQAKVR